MKNGKKILFILVMKTRAKWISKAMTLAKGCSTELTLVIQIWRVLIFEVLTSNIVSSYQKSKEFSY